MDFVRIRLTYDDSVEETPLMQRWLAEVYLSLIASDPSWWSGVPVKRARIVPEGGADVTRRSR